MNKAKATNKFWVIDTLKAIEANPDAVSYYHKKKLLKEKLLNEVTMHKEGRGRPEKTFELSGKARGYLAISKNWKRA